MNWPVVPLCAAQLRDVRSEDVIKLGRYRKCDTYRGGGGYDQFPAIAARRLGGRPDDLRVQFVVQLRGCPLRCPYCYVTEAGYLGTPTYVPTEDLVRDFRETGLNVFHLMGGAPALYLQYWWLLLKRLPSTAVFHSDTLLVEGVYRKEDLHELAAHPHHLIAVDIKGVTPKDYEKNTKRPLAEALFWRNFDAVVSSGINFYLTFTNPDPNELPAFRARLVKRYGPRVLEDSFTIDLVKYEALNSAAIPPR